MATGTLIFCGPCDFELRTTAAEKWCTECQEGLCTECQKAHSRVKTSRDHFIISIDKYRKIDNLDIKFNCTIHEGKLEMFCKIHDEALCKICVSSAHENCTDIIPIKEAAKDSKRSTAMVDLEDTLSRFLRELNISIRVDDGENTVTRLKLERTNVVATIQKIRKQIDDKLDGFERALSTDVNHSFNSMNSDIETLNRVLRTNEIEFQQILEQITLIKAVGSDLQAFLGVRKINDAIKRKTQELQNLNATEYHIEIDIDQGCLKSVLENVENLAKLYINEKPIKLPFSASQNERAQIPIEVKTSATIQTFNILHNLDLEIDSDIQHMVRGFHITGCTILSSGRIFLVSYDLVYPHLYENSMNGERIGGMTLPGQPFDITAIDNQRVAITFGEGRFLAIVNVDTKVVENKINLECSCWGVSFDDDKLYVVSKESGIVVLDDITGDVINTILVETTDIEYVAAFNDMVYYSDNKVHSVVCCDVEGNVQWRFHTDAIFHPRGIALDEHQNVLIVGNGSDNLSILSSNGTGFKTLLTESDGLSYPGAVCISEAHKMVCLGQKTFGVALYDVFKEI